LALDREQNMHKAVPKGPKRVILTI